MNRPVVVIVALVLAGIVFFLAQEGPVEACGRALVTFVLVLVVGLLATRPPRKA